MIKAKITSINNNIIKLIDTIDLIKSPHINSTARMIIIIVKNLISINLFSFFNAHQNIVLPIITITFNI